MPTSRRDNAWAAAAIAVTVFASDASISAPPGKVDPPPTPDVAYRSLSCEQT